MSAKVVSALLAVAAYTNASPAPARRSISYNTHCDEATTPSNWNDCLTAMKDFDAQANNDPNYVWNLSANGSPYNCLTYTQGECVAAICSYDGSSFTHNLVVDGFDTLISQCEPIPAGGNADLNPNSSMGVKVYQDPTPPSKMKARDGSSWENAYTVDNAAPRQYWQSVQDALPGGSSWALTESDSQTNMVEFSVSVSESFFDIFSSEQSVSYGYSETVTYSTTETIVNTCSTGDEGYLYWTPLFTQYHGGFLNGGPSPVDIYIPLKNGDGSAKGKYVVECSAQ